MNTAFTLYAICIKHLLCLDKTTESKKLSQHSVLIRENVDDKNLRVCTFSVQ